MKILITAALAMALLVPGCKKDKKDDKKTDETAATKPADTKPADTKPADPKPADTTPAVPAVELTGTPAENMLGVMKASVEAIKAAEPAAAAAALTAMLEKYDVADLRAKAKAAKEAGKGATEEQIAEFKSLKEAFKARAEELGKKDPEAFAKAAEAWSKAWGII